MLSFCSRFQNFHGGPLHRYHAAVDDTFTPKQRPGENYKGDTERCKAFVQEHGGFKGPYLDFKTAPAAAPL